MKINTTEMATAIDVPMRPELLEASDETIEDAIQYADPMVLRGLLYQPGSSNYRADKSGLGPFTRADLRAKIVGGDTLTFMGVPPGSGYRLGIDRNQDGVLDGDTPQPGLQIAVANTNSIVAWPTNANGILLERTPVLPSSTWSPDTNIRGVNGDKFNVTNSLSQSNALFFRLREL